MSDLPQSALFACEAADPAPPSRRRAAARAMLRMCNLGSGSGGNATVVCVGGDALLLDAGFGPRTTRQRLAQAGMELEQIRAICLTHLDQDHFRRSWPRTLAKLGTELFVHRWHLADLDRLPHAGLLREAGLVRVFSDRPFEPLPGVRASCVRCQHDMQGTISYRLDTPHGSVGLATDLGHAPPALIEHLAGVDLLAIECNYDERMTIHSSRPSFVNRRNMSDSGHLSNEQSLEAVRQIDRLSPGGNPRQIVLLHRSSQCNHPMKVKRVFAREPRIARRVSLTEQRKRTRWFSVRPQPAVTRHQMLLGF
ncbi:MAG: MBL fold metallo-hydrolase [Phycisphaeraceae bacterium]